LWTDTYRNMYRRHSRRKSIEKAMSNVCARNLLCFSRPKTPYRAYNNSYCADIQHFVFFWNFTPVFWNNPPFSVRLKPEMHTLKSIKSFRLNSA
jgi:hypothetical protein